jgi:hypothetical protein
LPEPTDPMPSACAWCGRLRDRSHTGGWAPAATEEGRDPPPLSHGVCPACYRLLMSEAEAHGGGG